MSKLLGRTLAFGLDQGDPAYEQVSVFRVIEAEWFDAAFPLGRAILVLETEGPFEGQFFALTSRWTAPLEEQLLADGIGAAVLNVIHQPKTGFDPSKDAASVGFGSATLKVLQS